MKIPSKLLLRLFLSYGLMNREAFEEHITRLLSGYVDDPDNLDKLYDFLFTQMDELKDYLKFEQMAGASSGGSQEELRRELKELKKAIELLTEKIDKQQGA
ncbi:MAG: hypothetical protein FD166_3206 [Bacteroidetes bacterium]|jgi:hypothetical protein|nr:MAG: hypothetical protein FD166_3206 [Bacteroidota bacterium]